MDGRASTEWEWLEMDGMSGNCWKGLYMDVSVMNWMELPGNGWDDLKCWKWLETSGNDWKWIEMAEMA